MPPTATGESGRRGRLARLLALGGGVIVLGIVGFAVWSTKPQGAPAAPRFAAGTSWAMIFELPGKIMLSPSPSSMRRPIKLASPPANAVKVVLSAHKARPAANRR